MNDIKRQPINTGPEMNNIQPEHKTYTTKKRKSGAAKIMKVIFVIASSFLIFWIGYVWGGRGHYVSDSGFSLNILEGQQASTEPDKEVNMDLFWKVWNLVSEKYVDQEDLNKEDLVYGAIHGFLKATGDPYTSFFDPEQSKSFAADLEGSFEGIGAELGIRDNLLTVIAPLDDSPAQKAGLKPNDKILAIDGNSSVEINIDDAVSKIRGPEGTEVKLTILREGEDDTREIVVTRGTITVESVKVEFKEDDIVLVRISRFSENTDKEFNRAVDEVISQKAKGIVIDVRSNPGGFLDHAVSIAGQFLPRGSTAVLEENKDGKRTSLKTKGGERLKDIPTVMLINEGSASASEILAGALRDNLGVTLIGKKSFGKGSVQDLTDLPGGSSVKITIAKWLTPNGDYIMDEGIVPDVEVDYTEEDFEAERDPQLDKALEILREKI